MKKSKKRGNGQGGCYRLPDGRWRWSVTVRYSAEGKQQRHTGIAPTKTQAEKERSLAVADHTRGLLAGPERVTVGQWLDRWLALKRPQVGPTTFEQYGTYLRVYVPADLRATQLRAVKPSHLRELDGQMVMRPRPLASATRRKVFSLLRAAFGMAVEEGLLANDPGRTVKVQASTQEQQARRRKALTADELRRLMPLALEHHQGPLFYLLFSLGLRRGEGLGLQWRDLDFESDTVRIERQVKLLGNAAVEGPLKTSMSKRTLYLADDLKDLLLRHRGQERVRAEALGVEWHERLYVFSSARMTCLHPRNVNRELKKLCKAAGIPVFSSHSGRHTSITHRLQAGQPVEVVAAIAGHTNINTTLSHYREVMEGEKRRATFRLKDHLSVEGNCERPARGGQI